MRKTVAFVMAAVLLTMICPTPAKAEGFSYPQHFGSFHLGGTIGVSNFVGGTAGGEYNYRVTDKGYLTIRPDYHGGYDVFNSPGLGKFMWTGTVGYRQFRPEGNDRAWSFMGGLYGGYSLSTLILAEWALFGVHGVANYHFFSSDRVSVGPFFGFMAGGRFGIDSVAGTFPMLNIDFGFNITF